jgi:hypothetical protein
MVFSHVAQCCGRTYDDGKRSRQNESVWPTRERFNYLAMIFHSVFVINSKSASDVTFLPPLPKMVVFNALCCGSLMDERAALPSRKQAVRNTVSIVLSGALSSGFFVHGSDWPDVTIVICRYSCETKALGLPKRGRERIECVGFMGAIGSVLIRLFSLVQKTGHSTLGNKSAARIGNMGCSAPEQLGMDDQGRGPCNWPSVSYR